MEEKNFNIKEEFILEWIYLYFELKKLGIDFNQNLE